MAPLLGCLLMPLPAMAQAEESDDGWRFTLLFPMIWAPEIKGDIVVGNDRYTVRIPFDEKIEDLDTGLIGEFYVHKGNWIGGVRLNYMRSKTEETTEGIKIPGGPTLVSPHRVETTTEEGVGDVILGYRVLDSLVVYGGARQFGQKLTMDLKPLEDDGLGFNTRLDLVDEKYRDAILGLSWTHPFNERWSLTVNADGNVAGDSDRNLFLEARAQFSISPLNNLWFGYRGSRIKLTPPTDGERITTDFKQHGPTIGWAFTF
jgi:hypothetical protein